ncbi:MAG: YidC/Oxa1 family membrane protein insertase [Eggerthellaceae bacterium]|nr:YidC/Oxa1 family membrane protein insertase [Eggerthellaceae bacterium]
MFAAVASVLQLIVQPCYELTGNWWVAIALFTVITKIILMPMALWVQWNSIKMVQIMPALNRLKVKHFGDRETIGEKQNELNKEKGYHPLLSLIPLAIQIIILFGLVDVVHSITDSGTPGTEFLGLVPFEDGGLSWIMPVLAGLSAVLLGFAQNRINPLQREQSRAEKNMTNGLSIGLSLILGVFVAAGMAFYWICSNLSAIAVQALCNVIIKPKKYIDYEDLAASRVELDELNSLEADRKKKWYQKDPLAKREKADYKRFFNIVGKHIVFYSEGSGFYKYFRGAIEYLLMNSNATIHYVTNDPNDQIFEIAKEYPRISPYYIGEKRAITLMMKMDADIVVTTLGDLDNFYIKRSYVRKDIEYVYMFHHMTSLPLTSTKGEYEHYDTLMCVGPHQIAEDERMEEYYGTAKKRHVKTGYDLLDRNIADYKKLVEEGKAHNERPVVLIAPSWQEDNILDSCFDDMLKGLLGHGWKVVVRPHPEYTKRYRPRWEALQARYADVPESDLYFEKDFSSNTTIFTSDILVTDWSSVFCEFSFSTLKPCIFVDTPMKVNNPEWEQITTEPTDITLRNRVGVSFAPENAEQIGEMVERMLESQAEWADRIEQTRSELIFNVGHGGEAAGEYLLEAMLAKQEAKKSAEEGE